MKYRRHGGEGFLNEEDDTDNLKLEEHELDNYKGIHN